MKTLKKIGIWTGAILGVLLLLLVIIASVFEKQIGKQVLKAINQQLETELKVDAFNLSLVRSFPNASAELNGVELKDALGTNLIEAETMAFRLGLFSLFKSKKKLKSIVLKNGTVKIVTSNIHGKNNYSIFKGSNAEDAESSDMGVSLDNAILENVVLKYFDYKTKQHVNVKVNNASASGDFSTNTFSFTSKADLLSNYIMEDKVKYFENKALRYDATIDVDMAKGRYEFKNFTIGIGENTFGAQGWVQNSGDITDMDIELKNKTGNLNTLLRLLPTKYQKHLTGLTTSGKFDCTATLKGKMSKNTMPAINVELNMEDGNISTGRSRAAIKDMSFSASYNNGKEQNNRTSVFQISDFKGYFNRELLEGGLRISNMDNPYINFEMDGAIPMSIIPAFTNLKAITHGSGEIEFRHIKIKGRYSDMSRVSRAGRIDASGEMEFDDAELTINKEKVLIDKGQLVLADNNLDIKNVKVEGPGTEMLISGSFENLLPVLFADSINSQKAELRFKSKLVASSIDIDRMMKLGDLSEAAKKERHITTEAAEKEEKIERRERITKFLDGTFDARIDAFNYNKIEGKNFVGKLEFKNNELAIDGKTEAMGGNFDLSGNMYFQKEPFLKAKLICDKVDVHEFMDQNENFGQDLLLAKNLKGNLDAKLAIYSYWDEAGNFQMDDLRVLGDINISEGELVEFKMLYEFSNVLKLKDLRRIKFTTLQNWLEIKKGKLYLPVMFIQSNAMNLAISGQQSFDMDMEYFVKVNAGQVIANKLKKHDASLKPLPAKNKGFFNLYYRIFGKTDDYKLKRSAKKVKQAFKMSEYRKKQVKQALYREFGPVINLEEPISWKDDIPEYEEEGDIEDVEYIEWDE